MTKTKKTKTPKKPKLPTKTKAKKQAWDACSIFIRTIYAANGYCTCVTCGKIETIKKIQAGHAIGGRTGAVLFDLRIIYPQCVGCNVFGGGRYTEFAVFLLDKYGADAFRRLAALKNKVKKYSVIDYMDIKRLFEASLQHVTDNNISINPMGGAEEHCAEEHLKGDSSCLR